MSALLFGLQVIQSLMISVQEILLQSGSHARCPVLGTVYWDTGAPGRPVPSPAPVKTRRENKVARVLFWLFLESVSSDWTFGSQAFSLCNVRRTPVQVNSAQVHNFNYDYDYDDMVMFCEVILNTQRR